MSEIVAGCVHSRTACPRGRYGVFCSQTCNCSHHCHPVTGECSCPAGFTDSRCETGQLKTIYSSLVVLLALIVQCCARCSNSRSSANCQLSLLPSAGSKMSSSLRSTGWRSDGLIGAVVCLLAAAPRVQLFASVESGRHWRWKNSSSVREIILPSKVFCHA